MIQAHYAPGAASTANVTSQTYAICNEIDISNRKKKHLIAWIFFLKKLLKKISLLVANVGQNE